MKRHRDSSATSSDQLQLAQSVERWFGELTSKAVRRGSFSSVADLQTSIAQFLEAWNDDPNPSSGPATVESIEAKLSGCRQTLEQIKPGCTAPRMRKKTNLQLFLGHHTSGMRTLGYSLVLPRNAYSLGRAWDSKVVRDIYHFPTTVFSHSEISGL